MNQPTEGDSLIDGQRPPEEPAEIVKAMRLASFALRSAMAGSRRRAFLHDMAAAARIAGAKHVVPIDPHAITDDTEMVRCQSDDPNGRILAGLASGLGLKTAFEIGTYRGAMTRTLAATGCQVWTLDLPAPDAVDTARHAVSDGYLFDSWDRHSLLDHTPGSERITLLSGDSGSFDFTPWHGTIDLLYIDGSHYYSSVRTDTERALPLLSERAVIAWDDYPQYEGVYTWVNQFAASAPLPVYFVRSSRLAIYSPTLDLTSISTASTVSPSSGA